MRKKAKGPSSFSGTLIHVDLVVRDLKKSLLFYEESLGFRVIEDTIVESEAARFLSGGASGRMRLVFLWIDKHSSMLELIQFLDSEGKPIAVDHRDRADVSIGFMVDDLQKSCEALVAKGYQPITNIFEIHLENFGKSQTVFFRDPEGYLIEFVGRIDDVAVAKRSKSGG